MIAAATSNALHMVHLQDRLTMISKVRGLAAARGILALSLATQKYSLPSFLEAYRFTSHMLTPTPAGCGFALLDLFYERAIPGRHPGRLQVTDCQGTTRADSSGFQVARRVGLSVAQWIP